MNIPVFSFVGYSNTGKTTYIEKLVAELKKANLRVAVIKHDAHSFEIDREGKDSWRFSHAGADVVAIVSSEKAALIEQRGLSLEDIFSRIHDVDIILTEGYKFEGCPKIGVFRKASGNPLAGDTDTFFAVVSDTPIDTEAPVFPLDSPEPLARYLLEQVQT